jgi:deazaflavin-dependent oxidoreductase (nitroreductase family)
MASPADTVMRYFNKAAGSVFQLSRGRLLKSIKGQPTLLLTVPGRRSGQPRSAIVAAFERPDGWLVVGSKGGMPQEPDWFKNLRAAELATVQQGETVTKVRPEVLGEPERTREYAAIVKVAPGFAEYERKSQGVRVIPIAYLHRIG